MRATSISKVLGYTQVEAMQLQLFDMLHPDDIHLVAAAMHKSLARVIGGIIDNIPEYIYVKNTNGEHIVNNRKVYHELLGAETEDETLGKTVFDYFGDILAADFQDDDIRIMSAGEHLLNHEESIIDQYGKKQWLSTTKIPIRFYDGTDQ